MQRRAFLATVGVAAGGSLAGCGSVTGSGESFDVGMTATAFDPPTVTVSVGEEVVWHNTSVRGHTVTAYENAIPDEASYFASGGFDGEQAARDAFWNQGDASGETGLLLSDESYAHTFEIPGEHHYFCVPHEQGGMVGTIVVEE